MLQRGICCDPVSVCLSGCTPGVLSKLLSVSQWNQRHTMAQGLTLKRTFYDTLANICCVLSTIYLDRNRKAYVADISMLKKQGRNHVFKVGGPIPWSRLLYRTKYGCIPSFVDCSPLRNGNHTLHQKSWGGPSKFWRSGPPQWLRPCEELLKVTDSHVYTLKVAISQKRFRIVTFFLRETTNIK